jgi:hypothetical protein
MDGKNGEGMTHAKMIFGLFFVCVVTFASNWAFAQGDGISGSAEDLSKNQGMHGLIITIKDVRTGMLAGTGATDASGNSSMGIPALGDYTLEASRPGFYDVSSTDEMELPVVSPNRKASVSTDGQLRLEDKSEEWDAGKSYLIPALEIPAFLFLLNRYDRFAYPNDISEGKKTYDTDFSTFRNHILHGPWQVDEDAFAMNQFNHPYQGSMYHGFARSAGLNYWEALVYDNVGSFLWETGGENSNPSINDQIASGFGGSFFGEALFRMSSLVLKGDGGKPGFWRELGAAMLSPPTGFNRLACGDRFKPIFPSYDPAILWRLRLGVSLNRHQSGEGISDTGNKTEATGDFLLAYGLPGKPGYDYTRPFDYFHFEFTTLGNADNPFDNIMIRGLLLGIKYDAGNSYRGIWGLYGGYDYISPHIFRVSSTSVSLGTTYQWWLSQVVALQGSVLGGVGYAAAGNDTQTEGERDYHYGIAPQGLLALRLILGDRAMFDFTGRAYYLTGSGGDDPEGSENIERLNTGFTLRIYGRHALGIQYIASLRNAQYQDRADSHQTAGAVGLVYTWLNDDGFGAVEWRSPDHH